MIWEVLTGFEPALLVGFIAAGLLLNITPGADFVFVSASGMRGGPRMGMAAALGVNLGIVVHVAMAAAGLSAVLLARPGLYDMIRYAGALYLVWLAVQTWRHADRVERGHAAQNLWRAVRRGFVTNVLNPKTALFIFAFIPQFTDPAIGPLWAQIVVLGAIFTGFGFAFSLCLGAAAGGFAHVLRARAAVLNRVAGVMFAGLAARLIWE